MNEQHCNNWQQLDTAIYHEEVPMIADARKTDTARKLWEQCEDGATLDLDFVFTGNAKGKDLVKIAK